MNKYFSWGFFVLLILAPLSANAFVFYTPLFNSTSSLTTSTGLSIAPSGGLVATAAGVTGTGYFNFPSAININQPWRFAALIQYNGDQTNGTSVGVMASSTLSDNELTGFRAITSLSTSTQFIDMNGINIYHQLPMVNGNKYWMIGSGDGNNVLTGVLPFARAALRNVGGTADQTLPSEAYKVSATSTIYYPGQPFQVDAFKNLERIEFKNTSTSTKILGFYVNSGSSVGTTTDSNLQPPGLISTTVNGDNTVIIRLPKNYDGISPVDVVYVDHPNGSDEQSGQSWQAPDGGVAIASLVEAGYIVVLSRGDPNSYTSPLASPWGATPGIAQRKAVIDYVKANFAPVRKVYWLGLSMGLLDGLNFNTQYPSYLNGIIGVSGVTNLAYAYNSEGLSSYINNAYATSSLASIPTSKDPNLSAAGFVGTPIKLWHGTADTLIHGANHANLFKTNLENAGGTVDLTTVTGAGHLDLPSLFDGPAMLNFLQDETSPTFNTVSTTTSTSSLVVSWVTNEPSTTQLEFGVSNVFVASSTLVASATTSHSVSLSGLTPCTLYFTKLKSRDIKYNMGSSTITTLTPGCTAGSQVATSTSAFISGNGTLSFSTTTLTVPSSFSATTTTAVFQAKEIDPTTFFSSVGVPNGKTKVGNYVVNLQALTSPTSTLSTFTTPLSVTISYRTEDVTNIPESGLSIYRYDAATGWTPLSSCTTNTSLHTVTCNTDHFSDFSVFGTQTVSTVTSSGGGYFVYSSPQQTTSTTTIIQATTSIATPVSITNECAVGAIYSTLTGVLCATTVQTNTPSITTWSFTKNLQLRDVGSQVKALQQFLNANEFFVTKEGPGSVGNETTYFGVATYKALIRFQKYYSISPASGYFGSLTRSKVEGLLNR